MSVPLPSKKILLVGNPNVGKSTLFNALCNRKQKTGNYAGVTVASHSGTYVHKEEQVEIIDVPGAYSIYPNAEDEAIFAEYLFNEKDQYNGVIYVADALNMKRALLLFQQIQDLGIPLLLVINQEDEAEKRGVSINQDLLQDLLQTNIIFTNAKEKSGIETIREAIFQNDFSVNNQPSFEIPFEHKEKIKQFSEAHHLSNSYKAWTLIAAGNDGQKLIPSEAKDKRIVKTDVSSKRLQTQETIRRYQHIDGIISQTVQKKKGFKELLTEKLDKILVHKFWGYVIFAVILLLIFQLVYFIASYPMDWIDLTFSKLSGYAHQLLPEGPINSLIADGIIPGIGGIVIFAPQIGILLYLLYLLEDSGYMARVVFLMDRFLRPFGLNGKSIVPLVSGTACAIPAIMSTRNIENIKERLITILVTPFMTCSARLPVYSIIIGLVIPDEYFYGISVRALSLLAMYILGFLMAIFSSFVLKKFIKSKGNSFLVMEMPNYKMPLFAYDLKLALSKVWGFITGAGKIIFVVSIIIWVLSYFGPSVEKNDLFEKNVQLENSYLAAMGKSIEPAISPLGYDWKMGVGILTSFAAREVFVGTMSTLYSLDDDAEEERVIEKMRKDTKPDGTKVFSFATGLSILVFYAFAMQCISTIAVVYRETASLKWTLFQTLAMSGIAYLSALLVYQFFK